MTGAAQERIQKENEMLGADKTGRLEQLEGHISTDATPEPITPNGETDGAVAQVGEEVAQVEGKLAQTSAVEIDTQPSLALNDLQLELGQTA
jgi:hypothetical protein